MIFLIQMIALVQSSYGVQLGYHYLQLHSKLEFSLHNVRYYISKYRSQVKTWMRNNKWQASSKRKIIKKDKANQILLFWNQKLNQQICIRDIKAGVRNSKSKDPPCNATISKTLMRAPEWVTELSVRFVLNSIKGSHKFILWRYNDPIYISRYGIGINIYWRV